MLNMCVAEQEMKCKPDYKGSVLTNMLHFNLELADV